MLRKLVALLFLITGLAALGQPAQAAILNVQCARASVDVSHACAAQSSERTAQRTLPNQRDKVRPSAAPRPPRVVLIVPTIMLQADRARE